MSDFVIRKSVIEDLPEILSIYERARQFMAAHGNPRQWNTTWPPKNLIREDIAVGRGHVCLKDDRIVGVFVYIYGKDIDPTYLNIEEGSWMDDGPYGAVHRIASSGTVPGVGSFCLNWAFEKSRHLRIDTHPDNTVMQNLLKKHGFEKRGIIHVIEDNDPRYAYEKI